MSASTKHATMDIPGRSKAELDKSQIEFEKAVAHNYREQFGTELTQMHRRRAKFLLWLEYLKKRNEALHSQGRSP